MNVWTILGTLGRRWWLSLPLAVVGVIVTMATFNSIDPVYNGEGQALMQLPRQEVEDGSQDAFNNPFLGLGSALSSAGQAVVAVINSPVELELIVGVEGFADYEVFIGSQTPIVTFGSESTDPNLALATIDRVSQRFDEILSDLQRQAGVDDNALISAQVLAPPSVTQSISSQVRGAAVAAAGSLLLLVVLTMAVDELMRVRQRRGADFEDDYLDEADPVVTRARPVTSVADPGPEDDIVEEDEDDEEPGSPPAAGRRSRWNRSA